MVRLSDIAKAVNLDVSVVSRALNPNPDRHAVIREETRKLVRETARKMGYRPNHQASFLRKGRSATILCFLPDSPDRLIADLLMGISETAGRENFPVNFFFGRDRRAFHSFIREAERIGHSGLLTYPPAKMPEEMRRELDRYHERGGNILLLNVISNANQIGLRSCYRDIPQLNIDDYYGGQLAAKHLIERGCEVFCCWPEAEGYADRRSGFLATLEAHGIEAAATDLEALPKGKKIGVFAKHDHAALQLLPGFAAKKLPVGEQVLLVGFDDQLASRFSIPSLSTVHQPTRQEGHLAMEKLIRLIFGETEPGEMLKPHLVVRESTGGARPDPDRLDREEILR